MRCATIRHGFRPDDERRAQRRRCWLFYLFEEGMASQPPVLDETTSAQSSAAAAPDKVSSPRRVRVPRPPIGQILRELNWPMLLLVGIGMGGLWTIMLIQGSIYQILAGLLPVMGGIAVGRRAKAHINWHAAVLGIVTALAAVAVGLILIAIYGQSQELLTALLFAVVTLVPFPAFGVMTAARSEQRAREQREVRQRRGGSLDRPGRVRTLEDLQGLSLPQLGGYVADLFRKHGFLVHDYRFEKERLDFQLSYESETWLLRVLTAEKVKPGVAQELAQRMKVEDVKKGVVITSMDFQEGATRWSKDKPVVLIDGATLLSMDD